MEGAKSKSLAAGSRGSCVQWLVQWWCSGGAVVVAVVSAVVVAPRQSSTAHNRCMHIVVRTPTPTNTTTPSLNSHPLASIVVLWKQVTGTVKAPICIICGHRNPCDMAGHAIARRSPRHARSIEWRERQTDRRTRNLSFRYLGLRC